MRGCCPYAARKAATPEKPPDQPATFTTQQLSKPAPLPGRFFLWWRLLIRTSAAFTRRTFVLPTSGPEPIIVTCSRPSCCPGSWRLPPLEPQSALPVRPLLKRLTKIYGGIEITYPADDEELADIYGEWLSQNKDEFVNEVRQEAMANMNAMKERRKALIQTVCDTYALDKPMPKMLQLYDAFMDKWFGETARNFVITRANIWERSTLIETLKQEGPVDGFTLNEEGGPSFSFSFNAKGNAKTDEESFQTSSFLIPVVIKPQEQPTLTEQLEKAKEQTYEILDIHRMMQRPETGFQVSMFYLQLLFINWSAWNSHIDSELKSSLWANVGFAHHVAVKTAIDWLGPNTAQIIQQHTLSKLSEYGKGLYELDLTSPEYADINMNSSPAAFALSCAVIEDVIQKHGEEVFTQALGQLPEGQGTMPQFYAAFTEITGEDIHDYIEPARARLIAEYEALPAEEAQGGQKN